MKYPNQNFDAKNSGDKTGMLYPSANMNKKIIPLDAAQPILELPVDGDFLYVDIESTGKIYIQINDMAMPPLPFQANMALRGFVYKKLILSWPAQAGLVVNLWYGYGAEVIPPNQNITSIGSITNPIALTNQTERDMLFGDTQATLNNSFIGGVEQTAAGAGTFSHGQLFNPNASGKTIFVDRISWRPGANNSAGIAMSGATTLATLVGTGINKNQGGAASVAQLRSGAPAAGFGTVFWLGGSLAIVERDIFLKPPIVLGPNEGVHVGERVANDLADVNFEWREY